MALLYFSQRTGSLHFIKDRFWGIFGGKKEFYDPELEKLRQELREIEHFRAEFNIQANTIEETKKFRRWVRLHSLPIRLVVLAKKHIRYNNFEDIKIEYGSHLKHQIITLIGLITITALSVLSAYGSNSKYWLAYFSDGNIVSKGFYLASDNFKLTLTGRHIGKEDCKNTELILKLPEAKNFSSENIVTLCSVFTSDTTKNTQTSELKTQKISLAVISVIFMAFSLFQIRGFQINSAANAIRSRLSKSQI